MFLKLFDDNIKQVIWLVGQHFQALVKVSNESTQASFFLKAKEQDGTGRPT